MEEAQPGWRVTATGIGNSGFGFSAISRGWLEPAAEGRTADSRKADAPGADTRHPKVSPANHPVSGSPLSAYSLQWVGLSALAQPRLTKGGQPYLET
jgi:hypothetical protein